MFSKFLKSFLEPSKWTNSIHDQDVKAGENFTLLCQADGIPVPQVMWRKKAGNYMAL